MTEEKKDTRSASQKLADAENAIMSLFNVVDRVTRDVMALKEATKLLNNKVDSIVKASTAGEAINDTVLERIMVENNVADLKSKVDDMKQNGFIEAEDTVSENAFVVAHETNDDGAIINPRIQFAIRALPPTLQEKMVGAKVGDTLNLEEGKLKVVVLETYKFTEPKAPEATAPVLAVVPDAAPETPAESATTAVLQTENSSGND